MNDSEAIREMGSLRRRRHRGIDTIMNKTSGEMMANCTRNLSVRTETHHRIVRYVILHSSEKRSLHLSWRHKVTSTGESPGRHKPTAGVFARALVCSHVTGVSLSSFGPTFNGACGARFILCGVQVGMHMTVLCKALKKCYWFRREKHFYSQTTTIYGQAAVTYRFPSDHRSQAPSSGVSTWMGDHPGTPRAVGNTWCTRHLAKPRPQVGRVC